MMLLFMGCESLDLTYVLMIFDDLIFDLCEILNLFEGAYFNKIYLKIEY